MSVPIEKAASLRRAAEEKIREIQANTDLTVEARARRIAEIRQTANTEVAKLKRQHGAELNERHDSLQRRLFGLSFKASASDADRELARMSYRDALFRADGADKPEAAMKMLARAHRTGDGMLSKAVLSVAYERGWSGVLEQHALTDESFSATLQELQGFQLRQGSRQIQFNESFTFAEIAETTEEQSLRMAGKAAKVA